MNRGATVGFTPRELRALRGLRTPHGIQRALHAVPYHLASTAWSPRRVLPEHTAHCLEGAIFAVATLRGSPSTAVARPRGRAGQRSRPRPVPAPRPLGRDRQSNFAGLGYREPVYRSLRELVMSYFEGYVNLRGDRTLRAYSRPVNLARFDRCRPGWMTTERELWWVAQHLVGIPHTLLLRPAAIGRLHRVDRRSLDAGLVGYRAR